MQPLQEAVHEDNPQKREEVIQDCLKMWPGVTRAEVEAQMEDLKNDLVFLNDTYQVNVRKLRKSYHGSTVAWLSIKRRDKEPCHDWRHFQEIKNQICGPEYEGIELYPAESRVVDTANQYHMYVILDKHFRWPFGFRQGQKIYDQDRMHGKQRPLDG